MEARGDTDVRIIRYAWRRRRWTNRTISQPVSLRTAETEQLYQGRRMIGGFGDMLFSIYSHTEPLKHVITVRGQILVSKTGDDTLFPVCMHNTPSVCTFKTSPCVDSKRHRVYRHHAHMLKHMCAWCRYTRRRLEPTHGDVLNVHTEAFLNPHTGFSTIFQRAATHTNTHHDHNDTHHTTHHTTSRGDRDRETEEEDRRRDKTRRQEKRRSREEKRQDEEDEREEERR